MCDGVPVFASCSGIWVRISHPVDYTTNLLVCSARYDTVVGTVVVPWASFCEFQVSWASVLVLVFVLVVVGI